MPATDSRLAQIEQRLARVEEDKALSTAIMGRLGSLETHLSSVEKKADQTASQVRTIEAQVEVVKEKTREVRHDLVNNTQITMGLQAGLDSLRAEFKGYRATLAEVDERTKANSTRLESLRSDTEHMVTFTKGLTAINKISGVLMTLGKYVIAAGSAWAIFKARWFR